MKYTKKFLDEEMQKQKEIEGYDQITYRYIKFESFIIAIGIRKKNKTISMNVEELIPLSDLPIFLEWAKDNMEADLLNEVREEIRRILQ